MKKIILIEDNKDILEPLSLLLIEEGFNVKTSVLEYKTLITPEWTPDIIIMDIFLEGKSGLEMTKEIKISYPQIPVILMSATENMKDKALSIGADAFIPKPFSIKEIKTRILSLI